MERTSDDGTKGTECVDLFGHVTGLSDAREIADDDFLGTKNSR
jgi:hypothetical protein